MPTDTFKRGYQSLRHMLSGFRTAWREEHNFRIEVFSAAAALALGIFLDLSPAELGLVICAIVLVLCAELINTAIEDLCDKVEPEYNPVIGKIKDLMAACVFTAVIGAGGIGAAVFLPHLVRLIP